ncbi:MAG: hypothetical protein SFU55_04585 [Methylophilus sp.]|nr:hypothetical protein [Methylophilus sp.]
MENFGRNVFLNCPFDDDYRQLLLSAIFTIKHLGYIPRLSLERANSAETRIDKIVGLIVESKFGIHDLSRMVSEAESEHYRMNMPFELGIDYGCKRLKEGAWSTKQILILEKERYRYQKALSDLSGSDIKNHDDEPLKIVKVIRDWFVATEELHDAPSGNLIWARYNEFQAYLFDELVEKNGHQSVDDVQIAEINQYMNRWVKENI